MSSLNALVVMAFVALAGALSILSACELGRPSHWRQIERWRDPAPLLFRLLIPVAQHFSPRIQLANPLRLKLQQKLDRAGIGYAILPPELLLLRGLTSITFAALATVTSLLLDTHLGQVISIAGAALAGGALYPDIWLNDHGRRRQRRFARQFPALLELLGLSVRAGLSFSAALTQSVAQLEPGPLADEMQRVEREIRTGLSRHEALERLARRIDLPAVQSFVSAIIQADETGGAISQALNDQATQRRRERFAIAEKKANEAPVKMLAPLVGLLFPVTFLIIGFPIAIQFIDGGLL